MAGRYDRRDDRPALSFAALDAALDSFRRRLLALLGDSEVEFARVKGQVRTLASKNPDLLKCDPATIGSALAECLELGLDLAPKLLEAYLVPRWSKAIGGYACGFEVGYMGLVKLAREAAGVLAVGAQEVRAGDAFEWRWEDGQLRFRHEPPRTGDRGEIELYYAWAKLENGLLVGDRMSVAEIHAIRDRSRSGDSGPWATDEASMSKKTVLRRTMKLLPKGTSKAGRGLARVLELEPDEQYEPESVGESAAPAPPPPARPGRGMAGLAERLGAGRDPEPDREAGDDDPAAVGTFHLAGGGSAGRPSGVVGARPRPR